MSFTDIRQAVKVATSRPIPLVIGFAGLAGAGKSTAARELEAALGYHKLSFADPIRDMFRAIGLTEEDLAERKEQPHPLLGGKTPRHAMQTLGTEWARERMGEDFWIGIAARRTFEALRTGGVVFDDVRFPDEADMIHDLGGLVIHVTKTGHVALPSGHASERGLPPELIDIRLAAENLGELRTRIFACLNPSAS